MLCLPLKKLNGYLFSINPERVKPTIRAKVIAYQDECFAVLHDYFHHGAAINPRNQKPKQIPDQTNALKKAKDKIDRLISERDALANAAASEKRFSKQWEGIAKMSVEAHAVVVSLYKGAVARLCEKKRGRGGADGIFADKLLICTRPGKCVWGCTPEFCLDYPSVLGDTRRAQLGNYMIQ